MYIVAILKKKERPDTLSYVHFRIPFPSLIPFLLPGNGDGTSKRRRPGTGTCPTSPAHKGECPNSTGKSYWCSLERAISVFWFCCECEKKGNSGNLLVWPTAALVWSPWRLFRPHYDRASMWLRWPSADVECGGSRDLWGDGKKKSFDLCAVSDCLSRSRTTIVKGMEISGTSKLQVLCRHRNSGPVGFLSKPTRIAKNWDLWTLYILSSVNPRRFQREFLPNRHVSVKIPYNNARYYTAFVLHDHIFSGTVSLAPVQQLVQL